MDEIERAALAASRVHDVAARKHGVLADLLKKLHAIDGDCDDAMDARYGAVVDVKWVQEAVDAITARLAHEVIDAEAKVGPLEDASTAAWRAFNAAYEQTP